MTKDNPWFKHLEEAKEYTEASEQIRKFYLSIKERLDNWKRKHFKSKQDRLGVILAEITETPYLRVLVDDYYLKVNEHDFIYIVIRSVNPDRSRRIWGFVQFGIFNVLSLELCMEINGVTTKRVFGVTDKNVVDTLLAQLPLMIQVVNEV